MAISRRAFLIGGGLAATDLVLESKGVGLVSLVAKALKNEYPNEYRRDGGLVVLPNHGTMYVASDFHGRIGDFERWLEATDVVSKIKNEEDVYGVLLGDVTDIKPGDTEAPTDGDLRIVDRIMEIKEELLGPGMNRFIYLQGNHEAEDANIYEQLRLNGMDNSNRDQFIARLYGSRNGNYFRQFNFVERMRDEHYRLLKDLPVAILGKNGIVCVHAGPSRRLNSPRDIAERRREVLTEVQWSRPHYAFSDRDGVVRRMPENAYVFGDVRDFLGRMEDATLLVTGHTPVQVLPTSDIVDGVGLYGEHQVIIETSYGAEEGMERYLVLDLGRRYNGNQELTSGREIRSLV